MGILVPVEIAITKISFLQKSSTNLSVPWVSLTCALTTSITGLIVGRIIYVSRQIRLGTDYTDVISLLVESAAPLSISGIAFAICLAKGSVAIVPLADVWGALAVRSFQKFLCLYLN